MVGVAWEGGSGVLVQHISLYSELGPLCSLSADTKEIANLLD